MSLLEALKNVPVEEGHARVEIEITPLTKGLNSVTTWETRGVEIRKSWVGWQIEEIGLTRLFKVSDSVGSSVSEYELRTLNDGRRRITTYDMCGNVSSVEFVRARKITASL